MVPFLMILSDTYTISQKPDPLLHFQTGQEAQLSQKDRATLCVIRYFAKSPNVTKVIWNNIVK